MKKFLTFFCIFLASFAAFSQDEKPLRIDASTPEKLQDTCVNIIMSLDDQKQQMFTSAIATIGVLFSQDPKLGGHPKFIETINGKTADEIIAEAQKLAPYIKNTVKKIDGSSMENFNKTIGQVLISLPLQKQTEFSEALAKIMYKAEEEKQSKEYIVKSLDGKTADETISMANKISTPFDKKASENIELSPLSDEETKKIKSQNPPEKKSLVPKGD